MTFIYPELNAETRTVAVRIELPNPDGLMKTAMYADVVFRTEGAGGGRGDPDSAVIDSGTRRSCSSPRAKAASSRAR